MILQRVTIFLYNCKLSLGQDSKQGPSLAARQHCYQLLPLAAMPVNMSHVSKNTSQVQISKLAREINKSNLNKVVLQFYLHVSECEINRRKSFQPSKILKQMFLYSAKTWRWSELWRNYRTCWSFTGQHWDKLQTHFLQTPFKDVHFSNANFII